MRFDITIQKTSSDNQISHQVRKKTRAALNRFSTSIQTVTIRITDTNGPKGGVDTQCTLSIKLITTGEVVAQKKGENVYAALNQCLHNATRLINRLQERRRNTPIRMNRRKVAIEDESDVMQS